VGDVVSKLGRTHAIDFLKLPANLGSESLGVLSFELDFDFEI
jgi:hypothetical protein